ncbi:PREDICTED: protein brunelleschi [Nicrophorus vespilloides]|uniref:Protein brunelleschi n=1 Tax=Nicrophorus vespilloides TaxID=110193 RepID=A0ABM1N440_NICVS|nr:PREDICTED: protein brunelleschi [Nicrophorus vespilloides]
MRSSVSYILSSSTTEPNMSHPDYEQYSHDHAALLILIRHIGSQLKPKTYNKFYDRISKLSTVKITDSSGQVRNIYVRYVKEYPVENNDWGDFQTHRRLLGLISIGKYDSQLELNEICRVHESLKVKYTSTLYDSRCILLKPNEVQSPGETSADESNKSSPDSDVIKDDDSSPYDSSSGDNLKSSSSTDDRSSVEKSAEDARKEKVEKLLEKLREEKTPDSKFTTPSNFKSRALFYAETEACDDLEQQLTEYVNSLFWVLESKRLEKSREKLERVSLLLAPFEKKDFVGLDMESRNNKKRCTGRVTKHLGDLCLQAGLLPESLTYYSNAAEILKSVNDWLWLGAAYEGLCAASALILYPNIQRTLPLHRNASLQEGSPKRTSISTTTNPDLTNPKKDVLNILTPEDIPKRYREAIIHYSKYQNAGIIETEASFKAARISVDQNYSLQAASFLQNVVFINITLSEQEKTQRFEMLSDLYTQIGFARKAAFCHRLAASRYVSAQNPTPNWSQCYNLMLQSFPGHKLSLDPTEMCTSPHQMGWPSLQIHLLTELVVAAKRMGHSALATRHQTFMLQTMWDHLTPTDQKELAIQLQSLSAQCEGAPVPLVLDNGVVIPPANLSNIPVCSGFTLKNLQPHLQPRKIQMAKQDIGPFLFTPINFGSLERKSNKPQSKMDFLWVENDLCEVTLKLVNPLPFELKVSNMRLLTAGVVFESIPETVILPSETPTSLTLNGTPKESGELELLGYSTHTLGVKSNCRLRFMKNFLPHYSIEVIPSLPVMEVKTSLPQSATFSTFQNFENVVTSASISLYNGESTECIITLTNTSQVAIEMLEVSIQSILEPNLQEQIFSWDAEEIQKQLPIVPNSSATINVRLYSAANFLASGFSGPELSSGVFGSSHAGSISLSMSAGPSSLPSRLNSPISHQSTMGGSFHSRRNDLNSSFRSSNSGQSSMTTQGCRSPGVLALPQHAASSVVEGQLQFRYSGGTGLLAGYCRSCSVFITLEMMPSLQVTNWDVLPAETSSQFYLVLDIANLTSQEMELHYTSSKHMLIEGHESCRIPVPVDRCPLSKLTKLYMENGIDERLDLDKICSDHIANLVDLRWQLSAIDTNGKATLKGITLTPNMLDIVRMSPLNWDVSINGDAVKPQEALSCEAGDCLEVSVKIGNSLEKALRHLSMSVQFYQDHQNGVCNYRLENRLATTGLSRVLVPTLEPQTSAEHNCNVLFFTPGQYKMDIQVAAPECVSATASISGHVWRFIPPVEINVSL